MCEKEKEQMGFQAFKKHQKDHEVFQQETGEKESAFE